MANSELTRRRFLEGCVKLGLFGVTSGMVGRWILDEDHRNRIGQIAMNYGEVEGNNLIEAIREATPMVEFFHEAPDGQRFGLGGTGVFVFKERGRAILLTNKHVIKSSRVPNGSRVTSFSLTEPTKYFLRKFDKVFDGSRVLTEVSDIADVGFVGFRYSENDPVMAKWKPIGVDWRAVPASTGRMATVVYQDEYDLIGRKRGVPIPNFALLRDCWGNSRTIQRNTSNGSGTFELVDFTLDGGSSGTPAVSLYTGKIVGIFSGVTRELFVTDHDLLGEYAGIQFLGGTDGERLFVEMMNKMS